MVKVIFWNTNSDKNEITDLNVIKKDIIDNFDIYWMQGSGDGYIEYFSDDKRVSMLMLGSNIAYGLYLHYIDFVDNVEYLSLFDKSRLEEIVETAEEIYASIGLFLPKEEAWQGI